MSVESLKRVLLKIKEQAREMRRDKHAKRMAPKPTEEKKGDTVAKIKTLLSEG